MATDQKIITTANLELFKKLLEKDYIKNLSVSGKTITYTKGDETAETIITDTYTKSEIDTQLSNIINQLENMLSAYNIVLVDDKICMEVEV